MRKTVGGVVAMAILLAGCDSKTDATGKKLGAAIGQYLDKNGGLCLNTIKWPVDVDGLDSSLQKAMPTGAAGRMAALEALGLAKSEEIEVPSVGLDGKLTGMNFKVKRYALTDAAKPFERREEVRHVGLNGRIEVTQTDLCWGQKVLDTVVKWEGPIKFGDYQVANVRYQYKIEGLAEWAKRPEFLVAFPDVGRVIDDAGKKTQQLGVKLTSVGWEASGLDN